jgi:cytochrome c biogenesis protein CcmG, thiol:disulfide interchange protein DsbE
MSVRTSIFRGIGALSLLFAGAAASAATPALLRPWPARQAAPAFAGTDSTGKAWNLAALRGKVVLVNFWASWCSPCVEEVPMLNRLAEERAAQVVVLGVNYKEASWTVESFQNEHPIRYPVLLDKSGELFRHWTNGVMPTTVLIGRDGKPRWRLMGPLTQGDQSFGQALATLLAEPAPNNEFSTTRYKPE